jgi:beta-phosphoglucomutase
MDEKVEGPAGVIFDMDGVLVNSNPYHLQKWVGFLEQHRVPYNPDDLPSQVLGPRSDTIIRLFLGSRLSDGEVSRLVEEVEERFRRVFRPHAKPLPGLAALVAELHDAGVPMAVASSAIAKNVEFMVNVLGFRPYFRCLVATEDVTHPKPHPEIYLKTAEKLGVPPALCVAFEDSYVGVESAKRAGMKCIAIASSFSLQELRQKTQADLTVRDFEGLTLDALRRLFVDRP